MKTLLPAVLCCLMCAGANAQVVMTVGGGPSPVPVKESPKPPKDPETWPPPIETINNSRGRQLSPKTAQQRRADSLTAAKAKRHVLTQSASLALSEHQKLLEGFPRLAVSLKIRKPVVNDFRDLAVSMAVRNTGYRAQRVLFDRPTKSTGGPWVTSVRILNAKNQNMISVADRSTMDGKSYTRDMLRSHYYSLEPKDWIMKEFLVANMVELHEGLCPGGKLPAGKYTLQVNFQNNISNSVAFTVR